MARALAVLALLALSGASPARAASTPDDRARFLAGLPASIGSPLEPLERTARWRRHAADMDAAWAQLGPRLGEMSAWAARELWPRGAGRRPVLYPFGGPDAITPVTVYPDAPVYLLAGLEPIGRISAPEALPGEVVGAALDHVHEALRSVVPSSFFRTDEMGHDLRGKGIDGVQPLVYLFLARAGARIVAAERIEIDPLGFARPLAEDERYGDGWAALRVTFQRPGLTPQQLVYVRGDLADAALARRPGLVPFVARLGPTDGLLKAASFILHDARFSVVRGVLLRSAATLLQDDSGVPFRDFPKGQWTFVAFGTYLVPKPPFQRGWQPDLARLFAAGPPRPLPFTWGYRHGPAESSLLLALKKGGEAR